MLIIEIALGVLIGVFLIGMLGDEETFGCGCVLLLLLLGVLWYIAC